MMAKQKWATGWSCASPPASAGLLLPLLEGSPPPAVGAAFEKNDSMTSSPKEPHNLSKIYRRTSSR